MLRVGFSGRGIRSGSAGLAAAWIAAWLVSSVAGAGGVLGATASRAVEGTRPSERRVDYSSAAGGFDRSYDLYFGRRGAGDEAEDPALVIYFHSRFWRERQPEKLIEGAFVEGLVEAGHTVAVLRHPLLPERPVPDGIRALAQGVAHLLERVAAEDVPAQRVFLAGHSSGAQLALQLALDGRWLAAEGQEAAALDGVLCFSGIVDLASGAAASPEEEALWHAAFPEADERMAASPIAHLHAQAPSVLLLTAANDIPGYREAASRFARALHAAGQPAAESFVVPGRDHFSLLALSDRSNKAREIVLAYLASRPREGVLPESWQVRSTWRNPPYSTEDLHLRHADLVHEYPADPRFNRVANRPFRRRPDAPNRFTAGRYRAIDLMALLEARGEPVDEGLDAKWLELTNVRGEQAIFRLDRLRRLAPRVVIGIDGERNLFRSTDLYHTQRRYTWVEPEAKRVDMARPLGAFVYFPGEEPGAEEGSGLLGRYGLTSRSFRVLDHDPYAPLADLPPRLRELVVAEYSCLSCHQIRGVGGAAYHLRARDGVAMGGYALPLERYPAVVWKRFVFEQPRVAEEVGASAVPFDPESARLLYEFIVQERERRTIEPWIHPERQRSSQGG